MAEGNTAAMGPALSKAGEDAEFRSGVQAIKAKNFAAVSVCQPPAPRCKAHASAACGLSDVRCNCASVVVWCFCLCPCSAA